MLELPLNEAHVILGCFFLMLFSYFGARGPGPIPTPHMIALTEFFHVHTETNNSL